MVNVMPQYRVRIDKQGRIVIPSEVRKILNLQPNTELLLNVRDKKIVLEVVEKDLEKVVDDWFKKMLEIKVEAKGFSLKPGFWMSEDYVKRKIGVD